MRVLMISGSYPPMRCGVGAYTEKLAEALAQLPEIELHLLTDRKVGDSGQRAGVSVLSEIVQWDDAALEVVSRLVRDLAPDLVHIQYPTLGYCSGESAMYVPFQMRRQGVACVQTWHEPILTNQDLWLTLGRGAPITVRPHLAQELPLLTRLALAGRKPIWIPAASMLPTPALTAADRLRIRGLYQAVQRPLWTYYGFVSPHKGVDLVVDLLAQNDADLVLACDLNPQDSYQQSLLARIRESAVSDRIRLTGFLPDQPLAELLAVSDAVILPFRHGSQPFNTTIDGALAQGSFVLTSSQIERGYHPDRNICYTRPGNLADMQRALDLHAGSRVSPKPAHDAWRRIAEKHLRVYREAVRRWRRRRYNE